MEESIKICDFKIERKIHREEGEKEVVGGARVRSSSVMDRKGSIS